MMYAISPTHMRRIAAAIERAHINGVRHTSHLAECAGGRSHDEWLIGSTSRDREYRTVVECRGRTVWVGCDCEAGSFGSLCQHVAYALWLMGLDRPLEAALAA